MKLGYARCSTLDQNLDWQIDALMKEGCDRIFQEKFTGTRKDRPELLRMMDMLREGDTVIICELIRERTIEGLASARARGRMGGRPGKDKKIVEQALTLYDSKAYSVDEISKTTGISRATLYKYVNLRKENQNDSLNHDRNR